MSLSQSDCSVAILSNSSFFSTSIASGDRSQSFAHVSKLISSAIFTVQMLFFLCRVILTSLFLHAKLACWLAAASFQTAQPVRQHVVVSWWLGGADLCLTPTHPCLPSRTTCDVLGSRRPGLPGHRVHLGASSCFPFSKYNLQVKLHNNLPGLAETCFHNHDDWLTTWRVRSNPSNMSKGTLYYPMHAITRMTIHRGRAPHSRMYIHDICVTSG